MCIAGRVPLYILHLWPPTAPRARALRLVLRTELTSCYVHSSMLFEVNELLLCK